MDIASPKSKQNKFYKSFVLKKFPNVAKRILL